MKNTEVSLVPVPELRTTETMFPVIEAQQASGLSGKAFCRDHHLAEHIFYYWLRKYRDQQNPSCSGFIRLEMDRGIGPAMRMNLGNGRSLDVTGQVPAAYLAELIRSLDPKTIV